MLFSTCYLFIFSITHFQTGQQINDCRRLFVLAVADKSKTDSLYELSKNNKTALFKAYHGASQSILAKHYKNPYTKLSTLKQGLNTLNTAVLSDAADIEIRFLRFSIEENIPSFLGIETHLESDKKMLLSGLNAKHPFYSTMRGYLLNSKYLNPTEKNSIK